MGVVAAAPTLVLVIETIGWHAAFGFLGVLGFLWVAAWLAFGGEGPLAVEAQGRPDALAERVPYRRLLATRTVLGVLVTGIAVYWGLALLVTWLPAFLQQGLGYGVAPATAAVTLVWGVIAIMMPLIGWLSQRAQRSGASSRAARGVPAGALALAAGATSIAALLLAPGPAQLALLVLGYSLGGAIFTLGPAMIGEIAPAGQRGALLGITTAVQTVAGMIAPAVTGRIIAAGPTLHEGYVDAFLVCGAVVAVGGLIGLALMHPEADAASLARRRPRARPSSAPQVPESSAPSGSLTAGRR